jgi:serine/threonine-protein kinase
VNGFRYRLGRRLGAGGMGEVFEALQMGAAGLRRRVAIKRVRGDLAHVPHLDDRLAQEARLCARLCHPNLVGVLDVLRDRDGHHLLVMELVSGVDLRRVLERGPLPPSLACHVASQLLRALDHVHGRRRRGAALLHGDVSPHNVMLAWSGHVKLIDFGVAIPPPRAAGALPCATGGKRRYMSPEQARGEVVDARSDLYSLGVVFGEMLVGCDPLRRAGHVVQPPATAVTSGLLPAQLLAVVHRLAAPEPAQRYPSAGEALADLLRSGMLDGASDLQLARWLARLYPRRMACLPLVERAPGCRRIRRCPGPLPPDPDEVTAELPAAACAADALLGSGRIHAVTAAGPARARRRRR